MLRPEREWTTADEEKAIECLESIASTLQAGEFVTLERFRSWDTILRGCGVGRSERYFHLFAGLPEMRIIEERPPGHLWDRIEEYDTLFVNSANRDVHRGLD